MPFQSVPETAEAVVIWLSNLQRCTMTFDFRLTGGYDQADIDALALAVHTIFSTAYRPLWSIQHTYVGTEVRGLESVVDLFASVTTSIAGTDPGGPMTNQDTVAIKRTTGFTGRSARGRVYIPLTRSMIDTNEDFILAATASAAIAVFEQLLNPVTMQGWVHVVVSRRSGGVQLPQGVTRTITNYEATDLEIDSQRRRMPSK